MESLKNLSKKIWYKNSDKETQESDLNKALTQNTIIFELDHSACFESVNSYFLELFNIKETEVIGKKYDLFFEKSYVFGLESKKFWNSLECGNEKSGVFKFISKSKKIIWLKGCYKPLLNESGGLYKVIHFSFDITSEIDTIASQKNQLKSIDEFLGIAEFDNKGRILNANNKFSSITGYSTSELKNLNHTSLVPFDAKSQNDFQSIVRNLEIGKTINGNFRRVNKDGNLLWLNSLYVGYLNAEGKLENIFQYIFDVTYEKFEMHSSQEQLKAVNETFAVIEFDLDGQIINLNHNYELSCGYSRSELIGQNHDIFLNEDLINSEEFNEFWLSLKRGHHKVGIFKRLGKNGKEFWLKGSYFAVPGENGKPKRIVKIASDFTDYILSSESFKRQIIHLKQLIGYIEFDLNGYITDFNEIYATLVGLDTSHFLGKKFEDLFEKNEVIDKDNISKFLNSLTDCESHICCFKLKTFDTKDVWLLGAFLPIFNNGKLSKTINFAVQVDSESEIAASLSSLVSQTKLISSNLKNGDFSKRVNAQSKFIHVSDLSQNIDEILNSIDAVIGSVHLSLNKVITLIENYERSSLEADNLISAQQKNLNNLVLHLNDTKAFNKSLSNIVIEARKIIVKSDAYLPQINSDLSDFQCFLAKLFSEFKEIESFIKNSEMMSHQLKFISFTSAAAASRAVVKDKSLSFISSDLKMVAHEQETITESLKKIFFDSKIKINEVEKYFVHSKQSLNDLTKLFEALSISINDKHFISHSDQHHLNGFTSVNLNLEGNIVERDWLLLELKNTLHSLSRLTESSSGSQLRV